MSNNIVNLLKDLAHKALDAETAGYEALASQVLEGNVSTENAIATCSTMVFSDQCSSYILQAETASFDFSFPVEKVTVSLTPAKRTHRTKQVPVRHVTIDDLVPDFDIKKPTGRGFHISRKTNRFASHFADEKPKTSGAPSPLTTARKERHGLGSLNFKEPELHPDFSVAENIPHKNRGLPPSRFEYAGHNLRRSEPEETIALRSELERKAQNYKTESPPTKQKARQLPLWMREKNRKVATPRHPAGRWNKS